LVYKFNFDLTGLSQSLFKEIARICDEKRIHKKMGIASRRLIERLKIQEMTGLALSDTLTVVEDLINNHIQNLSQSERFKKTDKRALFLPHCSRKHMDSNCQAHFDGELSSYFCAGCSSECLIKQATEAGVRKGYDVYVLPGGSCIRKILQTKMYEGVVGVACCEEINLARDLSEKSEIVIQAVPLIKNGCSNTIFNLETLKMTL
jgi:hypothetical protein